MPKNLKIFLFISIPVFFSSCQDWLELVPPDGLVRDEYWKSKEDLQSTLMGAYQQFAQLDGLLFMYGELRGDMIISEVTAAREYREIMNGNIFPDNSLSNWAGFYMVINYCNSVLKYAPIIYEIDQTFSEYQLKGVEAEAIYLRSLAYFYLVRIFRNVPLVLKASESDGVDFFLPASPAEEILERIKSVGLPIQE